MKKLGVCVKVVPVEIVQTNKFYKYDTWLENDILQKKEEKKKKDKRKVKFNIFAK